MKKFRNILVAKVNFNKSHHKIAFKLRRIFWWFSEIFGILSWRASQRIFIFSLKNFLCAVHLNYHSKEVYGILVNPPLRPFLFHAHIAPHTSNYFKVWVVQTFYETLFKCHKELQIQYKNLLLKSPPILWTHCEFHWFRGRTHWFSQIWWTSFEFHKLCGHAALLAVQ